MVSHLFWCSCIYLIVPKYFKSLDLYQYYDKLSLLFFDNIFKKRSSLILYIIFISIFILLLKMNVKIINFLYIFSLILVLYISYFTSNILLKIHNTLKIKLIDLFGFVKTILSSSIIIFFFYIYSFKFFDIFFINLINYTENKCILLNYVNTKTLFTFSNLNRVINFGIKSLVFVMPINFILFYYLILITSIIHLKEKSYKFKLIKEILINSVYDIVFFLLVFTLNIWLNMLITNIDKEKVLISLILSFIANSFKTYLIDLKDSLFNKKA